MAKISFYRGLKAKYNASTHADAIFFATESAMKIPSVISEIITITITAVKV